MSAILLVAAGAALLNLYALALVVLRAKIFGVKLYRPMILNIGLSIAPAAVLLVVLVLLFAVVVAVPSPVALWVVVAVGGLAWLLLLPNSAYLITELNFSHRKTGDVVPLWYDIVGVLTLALSGVVNTLLNVALAQTIFVLVAYPNDPHPLRRPASWVLAGVVLLLVTFGMYLGRYLRLNSWDVKHPVAFLRRLREHFRPRRRVVEAVGFCLTHAVLLGVMYLLIVAPAMATLG